MAHLQLKSNLYNHRLFLLFCIRSLMYFLFSEFLLILLMPNKYSDMDRKLVNDSFPFFELGLQLHLHGALIIKMILNA